MPSSSEQVTVHADRVRVRTPQDMTDEELATADELVRETMAVFQAKGDREIMIKLFQQQCRINREAKLRMDAARQARAAERMYPIPPNKPKGQS